MKTNRIWPRSFREINFSRLVSQESFVLLFFHGCNWGFFKTLEKNEQRKNQTKLKQPWKTDTMINDLHVIDMEMKFSTLYVNSVQLSIMPAEVKLKYFYLLHWTLYAKFNSGVFPMKWTLLLLGLIWPE